MHGCEREDRCTYDGRCENYHNCSKGNGTPPMGVGNHSCKYRDFVDWIISLDDLDMLAVRRSLTLSYIIEKAKSTEPKD